jgi:FAD/FMN-containing dehydrogenase
MGGARPRSDWIVLDFRGMRRIRAVDARSRTATVEPGGDFGPSATPPRLHPWARSLVPPPCNGGGAIGTNGLGYGGYLPGTMGDQVLGLEAVLADGTVFHTRSVVRSTTGLDLKRLFFGTEGTLGMVTAATLRIFPIPEREEIHAFRVPDFAVGLAALSQIYDDGLVPSAMDFGETFAAPGIPGNPSLARLSCTSGFRDRGRSWPHRGGSHDTDCGPFALYPFRTARLASSGGLDTTSSTCMTRSLPASRARIAP